MAVITWFGHSAFKVESGGASIIIDPFFPPEGELTYKDAGKVDIVLVTHDHGDHVGDTVRICRETGAMLACVVGTAEALVRRGVPQAQVLNGIGFNIGGTLEYNGVAMTMTQAFHSSDSSVPVGYVVRMADCPVFYHAGDTGIFSSMSLLGSLYAIQLGLLPIGGVFTMDARQAAAACKLLALRKVIPMHWGTFPVLAQSTQGFKEELGRVFPECACVDILPGQPMEF